MKAKPCICALILFLTFTAFSQTDPSTFTANLRAQYGPPLNRETFRIPAGEMIVDFSPNGQVCRIRLTPAAPEEGRNVISTKALDNFLLKLVPMSMRGKELGRMLEMTGAFSAVQITEYENVTISEAGHPRTGVTVTFKNETCADQPAR